MILQALKEYYDRKAADPESGIAPEGWEWKEIPFIVVIDSNGKYYDIDDTREGEGKKKRAKSFLVPQGVKKTSGIAANLLWDTVGYVFGVADTSGLTADKAKKAIDRLPEQKNAFIQRVESDLPQTEGVKAVLQFIKNTDMESLRKSHFWDEIVISNSLLTFKLVKENGLICRSPEVISHIESMLCKQENNGLCLVSGEMGKICELHTSIKGVYGAQTAGANIVSFNLSSFRSYQKLQGYNAPVSETAMFTYTTALNALLSRDSLQRIQVGDASTVFWSAKKTAFENDFSFFFKEPEKDDPDAGVRSVKNLFDSPHSGAYREDSGNEKFYVLGLSPNAARIAVRFWQVGTVAEFAERIRLHFHDMQIIKPSKEPEYYSIWRVLVNIATQDKSENIPPNIAGDFMRSVLNGTPYPQTLLQAAVRRIKSDTENRVKPVRAALIKAYLNRYLRVHPDIGQKELDMALDKDQPSAGYQLGRLFAVLEKIQEEGNPGLNATIRERYYGSACSSPVTVFGTLMRLKNHHIAKIDNKGRVINMERLIGEIVEHVGDFPAHLNLHEQGRFAIGYYHQRQDFFTKKEDMNN